MRKRFLHVTSTTSSAGSLKYALNRGIQVVSVELNLSTGCLPKSLSKEEYIRCKQYELWNFGDGASSILFGADLSKYDGIVVWHSIDVESMLVLGMIASCYEGKVFHIDVSKEFQNSLCGELAPQQFFSCLNTYRELSTRQRTALKKHYEALPNDTPCIKNMLISILK